MNDSYLDEGAAFIVGVKEPLTIFCLFGMIMSPEKRGKQAPTADALSCLFCFFKLFDEFLFIFLWCAQTSLISFNKTHFFGCSRVFSFKMFVLSLFLECSVVSQYLLTRDFLTVTPIPRLGSDEVLNESSSSWSSVISEPLWLLSSEAPEFSSISS